MIESVATSVYPLFATIPRIAAVFLILPLFSDRVLRGIARAAFVLALAMFVYPLAALAPPSFSPGMSYLILLTREALIGLALGFFLGTLFWVAEHVGYLIDLQIGMLNSAVFDPIYGSSDGPTSPFLLQFVIALVLAGGGLLVLLEIVFESYRVWPIHATMPRWSELLLTTVSARADHLFLQTLRFAAPFVVLLLLADVGLGLINRFAEHIDVHTLAMPIKGLVAFFILLILLSFIYESIQGLLLFDRGVLTLLRDAIHDR